MPYPVPDAHTPDPPHELGRIILLRHGETEWSRTGRHTGLSDIPLTPAGRERARGVRTHLVGITPDVVWCSPLTRARDTAAEAGLEVTAIDDRLLEWDYGAFEGRTTAEIRADLGDPTWTIWSGRILPGRTPGEQAEDVATRAGHVLHACQPIIDRGGVCVLVAHGHFLRILTATWLALPARAGRLFALDAGGLGVLGHERDQRVIVGWNT